MVLSGNRTRRLWPITVLVTTGRHWPSANTSTVKASTRCPEAMCSCNIKQLARTGAGRSTFSVTAVGPSVVVQKVSGLSSSRVATSPTDSPSTTSAVSLAPEARF